MRFAVGTLLLCLCSPRAVHAQPNDGSGGEVASMPFDGVFFAEVGWRIGLSPAARLPEPSFPSGVEDSRGPFEQMAKVWSAQLGGVYGSVYSAFELESYYGGARDDATPLVYTVRFGLGAAERFWDKGGPATFKTYDTKRFDRFGNPCKDPDPNEDPIFRRNEARGAPCEYAQTTTTTHQVDIPPGWNSAWFAVYTGYRRIQDFEAGAEPDGKLPLQSGGGPILGATAFITTGVLAAELGHEFVYYPSAWDDHAKIGWGGHLGVGARYFLVDLRGRLDPGSGSEFSFGARARLDLFF